MKLRAPKVFKEEVRILLVLSKPIFYRWHMTVSLMHNL
jgi:hypothetical protein